jgi:4'-phosphopantetheinyl transferase
MDAQRMPELETPPRIGPVRWVQLPQPPGAAAQPLALAWLSRELGLPEASLAVARDAHGRPRLDAPVHGHDVSWSHSGERLLVALGTGVEVGADLERLRPRPRALELAQRFFEPAETAWLAALPEDARNAGFVRLWCAKEAVLKAHGRGIAFGLHRFRIGEVDGAMRLLWADPALGAVQDWELREFAPLPGFRAALAWRTPPAA